MSTLSVLVEASSCSWGKIAVAHGESSLGTILRAIISFCNAHLALSASNKLLVFAYGKGIPKKLLFSSSRPSDRDVSSIVVHSLREILTSDAQNDDCSVGAPLAPAMAHAICHMKRNDAIVIDAVVNPDSLGPVQAELDMEENEPTVRAVVIGMTSFFGGEHGPLMNLFFSAAKQNICVDVVSLGEDATGGVLQQAADITGGLFLHASRPSELLPMLMTHVLAAPSLRSAFPQPSLDAVDYRASCACHHQLVSVGWVCSVCLSVLCQYMPICKVCKAVFKIAHLPRKSIKRKRT
ncbi:unnamed protein product [Caenorhabditis bovis]|uniref:General transcription factor IIH subunit 3 n=1 Tax=Caenorhabditis bovis TaxID=2654633 RepID=A0A8S1ETC7_9PELO|nr:unnamed protein product [Caenorhabditis bovis]